MEDLRELLRLTEVQRAELAFLTAFSESKVIQFAGYDPEDSEDDEYGFLIPQTTPALQVAQVMDALTRSKFFTVLSVLPNSENDVYVSIGLRRQV